MPFRKGAILLLLPKTRNLVIIKWLRPYFFIQRIANYIYNRVYIIHHIVIPKSQNLIPFGFQKFSSFRIIILLFKVLAAIQLNNKFSAWRTKERDDACHPSA